MIELKRILVVREQTPEETQALGACTGCALINLDCTDFPCGVRTVAQIREVVCLT